MSRTMKELSKLRKEEKWESVSSIMASCRERALKMQYWLWECWWRTLVSLWTWRNDREERWYCMRVLQDMYEDSTSVLRCEETFKPTCPYTHTQKNAWSIHQYNLLSHTSLKCHQYLTHLYLKAAQRPPSDPKEKKQKQNSSTCKVLASVSLLLLASIHLCWYIHAAATHPSAVKLRLGLHARWGAGQLMEGKRDCSSACSWKSAFKERL